MTAKEKRPFASPMSLLGHLQELRKHLVRSLLWIVVFSCLAFFFMKPLLTFLKRPYDLFLAHPGQKSISSQLSSLGIFEVMTINFKVCFLAGFIVSLPFILRELWKFVAPALYQREKKIVLLFLFSGNILFYGGLCFGFFLVIPYFFSGALLWASQYATIMITYENYFNSLIMLSLVFAAIFQIPVVLCLLNFANLLPVAVLKKSRRIVFLACFIVGAILAPPDVVSLCIVALSMYFMFEASILISKKIEKNDSSPKV